MEFGFFSTTVVLFENLFNFEIKIVSINLNPMHSYQISCASIGDEPISGPTSEIELRKIE